MGHSTYYDLDTVEAGVVSGQHRELIGGLWEEMGPRQLDFLISRGLTPQSRLLDIGCGSLRLGAVAVPWLEPLRYFGTDLSAALIEAGRALELDDAGREKAPAHHFAVNEDFDFGFLPKPVEYAIAQSVFTHLPLNHLRRCMARLAGKTAAGARCLVTYFPCPDDVEITDPLTHVSGVVTHDWKDPYHYRATDLVWAVAGSPWRVQPIGDWGHPRGQHIVEFVRL